MSDAAEFAYLAGLVGEPTRARMLAALMGGVALTPTELALEAGVAPSTASEHLAKLSDARVLVHERQGRHRYFRLSDPDVAHALESLMGASVGHGFLRRPGPRDPALRAARVCYDHLAGERGVWLLEQLRVRRWLPSGDSDRLPAGGEAFFAQLGVDLRPLVQGRRPLCRLCLDWSERRHHLGGALGAAILDRVLTLQWARRRTGTRAVLFTPAGERALRHAFGAA